MASEPTAGYGLIPFEPNAAGRPGPRLFEFDAASLLKTVKPMKAMKAGK